MVQTKVTKQYLSMILMATLRPSRKAKLTVKEFLTETDLCRTTFYNHFPDGLCGLFRWTLEDRILNQVYALFEIGQWQAGFTVLIDFISQRPNFCCNLYYLADAHQRKQFFKRVANISLNCFLEHYAKSYASKERQYLLDFYSAAIVCQLEAWFESNLKTPSFEIQQSLMFNLMQLKKGLDHSK